MDDQACSKLMKMYRILGETYGTVEDRILSSTPGWNEELRRLEDAFTEAWQGGRECGAEFQALREHWKNGIRTTRDLTK